MLKHDDCFLDCYIDGCLLSVMQSSILINKMPFILQTVAATWILFNIYTHPINHTIAIRIITSTVKSICFRLFANTNQCKRICVYTMHDSWMPMHHSNSIQSISILLLEMVECYDRFNIPSPVLPFWNLNYDGHTLSYTEHQDHCCKYHHTHYCK